MRKAVVAGQFYPAEKEELQEQIESCFNNKFGPGKIDNISKSPSTKSNIKSIKSIRGLISPHAGYIYSGPCASHGFSELLKMKKEDLPTTFILLGPNHSGYANSGFSLSLEDFETPLGIVKNNKELGKKLLENCKSNGLKQDELAHRHEHSIEVQLPFLQYIYTLKKTEFRIIPIVISTNDYNSCIDIAKSLAITISDLSNAKNNKNLHNLDNNGINHNRNSSNSKDNLQNINDNKDDKDNSNNEGKEKICILASSDFTHFGENYGFKPFSKNIKENPYSLDKKAISDILQLDSKGFYEKAMSTTICGTFGIIILIEILKQLDMNKKKAKLLKYYTSGDITNDYDSAVGYASIIFSDS